MDEVTVERKPLATRNNANVSKLPMSSTKLPMSSSRLKRARSPDVCEPVGKKSKVDHSSNDSLLNSSKRSVSSSSLTKAPSSALKSNMKKTGSSTNLMKKPAAGPVTSRNIQTVAAARNARSQIKPIANTVARPKPTPSSSFSRPAQNLDSSVVSTGMPKKRPAWDLKGRLQDMETFVQKQALDSSSLQNKMSEYLGRIALLESTNQKLSGDVEEKEVATKHAGQSIQELRNKLSALEQQHQESKRKLLNDIEDLEFQKQTLERHKITLEGDLAASLKEISQLKMTVSELTSSQATLRAELECTKVQLTSAHKNIAERDDIILEKINIIRMRDESIQDYQMRERCHETERRKLHNTIQELKGNIRVFCRVRPLLGEEQLGNNGIINHINFPDMDSKIIELDKLADVSVNESMLSSKTARGVSKYEFTFDKVFKPESSQSEVFEEISQLVQSALDGYNVCIFAYGQTGSGKTFTMEGSLDTESQLGMIPRAVKQIFKTSSDLSSKGWQYVMQASMLEIYNETIRDLLGKARDEKLEIKMIKGDNDVHVPNLTIFEVKNEDQVLGLLRKASENRAVAETKCNEHSSRSHSVFQLRLTGTNNITGESCKGMLNLVDLAGSEKVKDSGSEGLRLNEANKINSSLSHLQSVFLALTKKDKHIPYRNSKLTHLLQNSLGGNSKTLMFVNVSPKEECFSESLTSLRFATTVNQCNIGTAQKKKF
ncbi:carboxy-terminal kinesin 2-like isoform X2 [Biomphalaria glabrata]|nr:carboxy-terminal kinesin 2-like isoform X2 [Biomphalaria glabrata]